jgi:hypothetical protein
MTSDDRTAGRGPDDMGDDEQEFEIAEYEQYIEDPPDSGLAIAEDDDDDAEKDVDWAETHPRQVARDGEEADDRPAESSAIHEIPGT